MLTVPEAARRAGRDPETIRRWIRSGRLRSRRVGTQHIIDESDLLLLMPASRRSLPAAWRNTATGEPYARRGESRPPLERGPLTLLVIDASALVQA